MRGVAISAAHIGEQYGAPRFGRQGLKRGNQTGGPAAKRKEVNAHRVEFPQIGIGGKPAVEDHFFGQLAGTRSPAFYKVQDLGILGILADPGIGVGKPPGIRIAGQKGQETSLAPAALGDVVLFHQGPVSVTGNGVEVQIEEGAASEDLVLCRDLVMPAVHECEQNAWIDAAAEFTERGPLGYDIEARKQGQSFVQDIGHDVMGAAYAPELEGQ